MRDETKTDLTDTTVTVLPSRGVVSRQNEKDRARAKAVAAIKTVERVRFLKKLKGEDCSAVVMTLADLEKKHLDAAKPKKITVWDLLVWTYDVQRAGQGRLLNYDRDEYLCGSSWDWDRQVQELGVIVQGGGGGRDFVIAADAATVHGAVHDLPREQARVVVRCATLGQPPTWVVKVPAPRCEPVLKCNGKPKMLLDASDNVIGCKVVCSGVLDMDRYEMEWKARQRYTVWYSSLRLLEAALSTSGLKRHITHGIGVRGCPWDVKSDKLEAAH